MFSNKENVNILTALLLKHGVRHAVVCPGSRNSPIVHNLNECEEMNCYPVTDERSAGFYALGMCQALDQPVVVCVTSGSALLNVAPAAAEAYYQHLPLIIVSADRPIQWIDQLDGQTMQQTGALQNYVRKSVSLPEPHDEEEHWYCNRLVNEALLECRHRGCGPVHINVPITEPLYQYTESALPEERPIIRLNPVVNDLYVNQVAERFMAAERPMVVIGQMVLQTLIEDDLQPIADYAVVLREASSPHVLPSTHFEEVLVKEGDNDTYQPDFILYIGSTLVSKRLKQFLRKCDAEEWTVDADGEIHDTFMHLDGVIEGEPADVLGAIADMISASKLNSTYRSTAFHDLWQKALVMANRHVYDFEPSYSQMSVVKYFEEQLEDMYYDYRVQYGNSSAVRLGNIYAGHQIYVNRGINGIEGSLSTAAGMSVVTDDIVYCVLGDLSFFYDQNALWNRNLKGNLRIILLNNECGGIFTKFDGLKESKARDFVIGTHQTKAQGICTQNDVGYLKATSQEEMQIGMVQLMTIDTQRPVVLEVFTDAQEDDQVLKNYWK